MEKGNILEVIEILSDEEEENVVVNVTGNVEVKIENTDIVNNLSECNAGLVEDSSASIIVGVLMISTSIILTKANLSII